MTELSPNQQLEALMDRLAADVAPVQPLEDRPTLLNTMVSERATL